MHSMCVCYLSLTGFYVPVECVCLQCARAFLCTPPGLCVLCRYFEEFKWSVYQLCTGRTMMILTLMYQVYPHRLGGFET